MPWDYEKIVKQYLTNTAKVLDYDTGGVNFIVSESSLCQNSSDRRIRAECAIVSEKKLLPLGIDFKECNTPSRIPYDNETFDMIINRHGNFDARNCIDY